MPLSPEIFLIFAYGTVAIISGVQLGRIVYYRHSVQSFHFGFLMLAIFCALLRTIWFIPWSFEYPFILQIILIWLPTDVQFGLFSLLLVFYKHMVSKYRREWEEISARIIFIYFSLNILSLFFSALTIYWANNDVSWAVDARMAATITQLTVLIVMFSYYGWQVLFSKEEQDFSIYIVGLTRKNLLAMTVCICLSI